MRLRSLTQTHHSLWRSSQDFSRSSWTDQERPIPSIFSTMKHFLGIGTKQTMSDIVFRRAQCRFALGEEAPEAMVGCRVTPFHRLGRRRFRQWVLRNTQSEFRTTPVNSRHTTGLAEIPALASGGRGGREVGGLDGRPNQREMERRRKVCRGQLGQRKTPNLASKPCDILSRHGEGVCVWTVAKESRGGRFFSGTPKSCGWAVWSRGVSAAALVAVDYFILARTFGK